MFNFYVWYMLQIQLLEFNYVILMLYYFINGFNSVITHISWLKISGKIIPHFKRIWTEVKTYTLVCKKVTYCIHIFIYMKYYYLRYINHSVYKFLYFWMIEYANRIFLWKFSIFMENPLYFRLLLLAKL